MASTGQYVRIGCYGKLPFYEEWLEELVSFPSSRALKQWIHEGRRAVLEARDDDAGKDVGEVAKRRFLFGLPGSVELIAGVIRPSSDKGGLRPAPFMVFVNIPRRLYGGKYGLLPMALAPVWDALDDAWDSLGGASTLSGFKETLAATMIPMPAPPGEIKAAYESHQREAISRIFESRRDGARLETLSHSLPGLLERIKKTGEAAGLSVDLPVTKDAEAAAFDASYWIDLINRQFFWKKYEPSVFLDGRGNGGDYRALLIFGIIAPSDYPAVMKCGTAPPEVCRPADGAPGEGSAQDSSAGEFTYAQFLTRRIAGGS